MREPASDLCEACGGDGTYIDPMWRRSLRPFRGKKANARQIARSFYLCRSACEGCEGRGRSRDVLDPRFDMPPFFAPPRGGRRPSPVKGEIVNHG